MTEEIIEEEIKNPEDAPPADESKASESGWRPEDEWEGAPEEWIDARTFNMRGELMDRIKSQTSQLRGQDKKIQRLEDGLQGLADHNKHMDEIAFKRAIDELKSLKKDALEYSDHEQVVEIDEKMSDLKRAQETKAQEPTISGPESGVNPEVVQWIEKNDWYTKDVTLRGAADALAVEIVQSYPDYKAVTLDVQPQFLSHYYSYNQ